MFSGSGESRGFHRWRIPESGGGRCRAQGEEGDVQQGFVFWAAEQRISTMKSNDNTGRCPPVQRTLSMGRWT